MAAEVSSSSMALVPSDGVSMPGSTQHLPFDPPEQVKKWLRPQDWEAMTKAWEEAEAQALAWASGDLDDVTMWEDPAQQDSQMSASFPSSPGQTRRQKKKKADKWKPDFHLLGQDSNKPPPLRRYFDHLPSEASMPKQPMRKEIAKLHPSCAEPDTFSIQHPRFAPDISEATARRLAHDGSVDQHNEKRREGWEISWNRSCSEDNDMLNPLLRHYFDRRGLEAGYRMRPNVDKCTPKMRPRTPGRPSTREKILRCSTSEPAITHKIGVVDAGTRGIGNINWSRRCLTYGPDTSLRRAEDGSKIPWCSDIDRVESEDNEILNPILRHYFERDGLESSFRLRGRHYGRPLRSVMGLPQIPTASPGGGSRSNPASTSMASTNGGKRSSSSSAGSLGGSIRDLRGSGERKVVNIEGRPCEVVYSQNVKLASGSLEQASISGGSSGHASTGGGSQA